MVIYRPIALGLGLGLGLARRGLHVFATAPERARQGPRNPLSNRFSVTMLSLDVAGADMVVNAISELADSGRGMNVLVKNAGINKQVAPLIDTDLALRSRQRYDAKHLQCATKTMFREHRSPEIRSPASLLARHILKTLSQSTHSLTCS
ncbi:hypothetical protein F4778DRAFT_279586 [Xylariomycetidae sp. FL2044]|nr:hypothetical protein F4778DRAFT_279586 [Xylariomycetidae sp. FL2044]